jgi:hypothetical protein
MNLNPMVKDKKLLALKELIKQMFELEASGEKETAVDIGQELHEAVESPEEEGAEHLGGVTEEEENAAEDEDDDSLKSDLADFFKGSKKKPAMGKTKKVMPRPDFGKPKDKKTLG